MTASMRPVVSDLVPVGDRLRWALACRAGLGPVAVALAAVLVSGHAAVLLAVLWTVWTAATAALLPAVRRDRRSASAILNVSLLGDGALLAVAWHTLGGLGSPGVFLVLLHIIGVTLLASFRTGAKITIWHGLLAVLVVQSKSVGLLGPIVPVPAAALSLHLFELICTAVVTASFAAANERELRRRRYDDHVLRTAAGTFVAEDDTTAIAAHLVRLVRDELLARRALVIVQIDDAQGRPVQSWAMAAGDTLTRHTLAQPIDRNGLIARALGRSGPVLVPSVTAGADPDLVRLLPDGRNLACVPFAVQQVRGVLVLENSRYRSARRSSRISRRMLATVQHATSLAAVSMARAVLVRELQRAAETDPLTGVANRRTLDASLARILHDAGRDGTPTSVALVDLDHFKKINDVHGHQTGDEVLRLTGAALTRAARSTDLVARYGGEEFAVVMPATTGAEAAQLAERIRRTIAEMPSPVPLTASLGVSSSPPGAGTPHSLVAEADAALYAAKGAGRNTVVWTGDPSVVAR